MPTLEKNHHRQCNRCFEHPVDRLAGAVVAVALSTPRMSAVEKQRGTIHDTTGAMLSAVTRRRHGCKSMAFTGSKRLSWNLHYSRGD